MIFGNKVIQNKQINHSVPPYTSLLLIMINKKYALDVKL